MVGPGNCICDASDGPVCPYGTARFALDMLLECLVDVLKLGGALEVLDLSGNAIGGRGAAVLTR